MSRTKRSKICKASCELTRKLRKNFVVVRFGNDYVLATPLQFLKGR